MALPARFVVVVVLLAAGLGAAENRDPGLQKLVDNSPFGSAPPAGATGRAAAPPVEFHGIMVDGGETMFSVFIPAQRRSFWLRQHETMGQVKIEGFDSARCILNLVYEGRPFGLPLYEAKVVVTAPPALPAGAGPGRAGGPTPASVGAAASPPEVRAAVQKLAEAKQQQAYENRRRLVLERLQPERPVALP